MPSTLFISYSHSDVALINWLERLKIYLAPLRRTSGAEIWDDTRIEKGAVWRKSIRSALNEAKAAILLVGPGFLASDFVCKNELPILLKKSRTHGLKIYPLVVGYSGYRLSPLEPFQAFNNPDNPLEALPMPEQNRILNNLSLAVDEGLRHSSAAKVKQIRSLASPVAPMQTIHDLLSRTWSAFVAQSRRRNVLVAAMRRRLRIRDRLQYEKFFFHYFHDMNRDEKFEFSQIRAITEGPLHEGNSKVLDLLSANPDCFDQVPAFADLQQHLVFWLNKYERVFKITPEMCVLYTGVEDGVKFPPGVDKAVAKWLDAHQPRIPAQKRGGRKGPGEGRRWGEGRDD
jgi:hypothetical protein